MKKTSTFALFFLVLLLSSNAYCQLTTSDSLSGSDISKIMKLGANGDLKSIQAFKGRTLIIKVENQKMYGLISKDGQFNCVNQVTAITGKKYTLTGILVGDVYTHDDGGKQWYLSNCSIQ